MESNKDLEKDAGTPFDITPSRRSSRKKQSTFSDDFEYYTPTGRKKEDDKKPSPQLTPTLKGKNKTGSQKSGDSEEEVEGSVENSLIRKKPGPKPKVGKGKPKTIVKKTAKKGLSPQKKKKAERKQNEASEDEDSSEEEDEEEGSDSDESEEDEASSGKKRKIAQGANKKVKTFKKQRKQATKDLDQEEEESSSDEEDSTPISQLQAQLKQQQAAAKGPPLAQNLAKKLLEVGAESSSGLDGEGDATPALGTKRKQAGDSKDAPPTKKTVDVSKLGSALAALAKSIPPEDLGLVKRSQSEIAAKMSKPVVKSLIKEEETSTQKNKSADIKDFKPVKPIASKHAAVDKLKQEAGISEKKPAAGVEKQTVKMEKESDVSGKPEKTKVRGTDESLSKKSKFEEQQLKNKQGKTVMTKDGKVSVLSSPKTGKESLLKKDTSGKQSTPRKLTESEIRQKKIEQIKAKIAEKSAGQRSFLEKHSSLKPLDGSVGKHVTKEGSKVLEMSKKKLDLGEAKAKSEVSSKKFSSNLASSLAKKKSEIKGHEDIFKRAILHKKKSHPFFTL